MIKLELYLFIVDYIWHTQHYINSHKVTIVIKYPRANICQFYFVLTFCYIVQSDVVKLSGEVKAQLMSDLLTAMQAQFCNGMTVLNIKLASITSALYLTLMKQWKRLVLYSLYCLYHC